MEINNNIEKNKKVKKRGPGRPKKRGRKRMKDTKKKGGLYLRLDIYLLKKLRENKQNDIKINEQIEKALEMYFNKKTS